MIDGPPRVTGIARSALLAADLVLIPVQPSPFDGWASAGMLRLLDEACVFRLDRRARFVMNRCAARTLIARDTAPALADQQPSMLQARIGQRVAFADVACTGRLVDEADGAETATREIAAFGAAVLEAAS